MIITPPFTREQQIVLKVAEKRVGGDVNDNTNRGNESV